MGEVIGDGFGRGTGLALSTLGVKRLHTKQLSLCALLDIDTRRYPPLSRPSTRTGAKQDNSSLGNRAIEDSVHATSECVVGRETSNCAALYISRLIGRSLLKAHAHFRVVRALTRNPSSDVL
jgi:hypothetical protein